MRKYKLNEYFFDEINEKSAYWLGFLYADGCVRMKNGRSGELKLKLKDTDKSHIEKFLKDLECDTPIKFNQEKNSKFCYCYINSNYMIKKLFELGCVENKTQKIRLPNLSSKHIFHFLRGYFDGDGSISKLKNRPNSFVASICSNKNFIEDIAKFLGFGKIYEYENYSVLKINKLNEIKKFRNYLYEDSKTFLLRKYEKFNLIIDDYQRDYSKTKNKKEYKLINPNGNVILTKNLRKFCEDNKLKYSTMSNLSRGIGKTNGGWKCYLN
jgi:hypothetical protein